MIYTEVAKPTSPAFTEVESASWDSILLWSTGNRLEWSTGEYLLWKRDSYTAVSQPSAPSYTAINQPS